MHKLELCRWAKTVIDSSIQVGQRSQPFKLRTSAFRAWVAQQVRSELGHSVGAAAIEEALTVLQEAKFDCLILDLKLPNMSGFELLQKIKKDLRLDDLPVIVYTGKDLTQEEHFDELPFGTHGGTVVRYTFPLDAEYQIQIRLQRDRNEHIEGLHGEHQVELMLDGKRVKLFTVKPPPSVEDHHLVEKDLNIRVPVKAGPHMVAVAFPKMPSTLLETGRQPYQAHFNMDRHPRITPALFSISINGPYQADGPGDTPSRHRLFVCRPSQPAQEDAFLFAEHGVTPIDQCAQSLLAR